MEPVRSFCKDSLAVRIYADRIRNGARRPRGTGLLCCAVCWRSRTPCAPYLPPLLLRMNFWKHCAPRRISTGNALPHSTWMNMWAWMQRRPKASATFCAPACSTVCPLAKYAI